MRTIIALMGIIYMGCAVANAADLGGSMKDRPAADLVPAGVAPLNVAGFYVSGHIGTFTGNRDISRRIDHERGTITPGIVDDPETPEIDETVAAIDVPVHQSFIDLGGSDEDLNGMVFGGGLSYLAKIPDRRFALEIAFNADIYTENETRGAFGPTGSTFTMIGGQPVEDPTASERFTSTGEFKFSRDFDLDLLLKGHVFVTDRMSIFGGGGLSWAFASLKAESRNVDGNYSVTTDDDGSAFGFVLAAGFQYWMTDTFVLGGEYNYKRHDFDFEGSSRAEDEGGEAYRAALDRFKVEDELHTFKVKAAQRF
jgi:opacity protein-like surface antigen